MKKLNVLFSNSNPAQMWGGGEKWMVMTAKGLQERGHKCIVAARKNSQILRKSKIEGVKTKIFELHSELNIFKFFKIAFYLKKKKIDIVILNITKDVRMVGAAARLSGVKLVVARHGAFMISDKFRYKLTYNFFVDKIVTNSYSIKNKYKSFGWIDKKNIEVIANGVELPKHIEKIDLRKKYGFTEDCLIFGAFGRLVDVKGFDVLVKAASLIKSKDFVVLIFGEGNQRKFLEELIAEKKVEDKVFLKGHLDDVYPYMAGVDCTILSSYSEGMPNTVLESMLLGKLVISTDIVDMSKIICDRQEGLIVKSGDEKSLASAIGEVVEDFFKFESMAKKAQIKAKNEYTMNKMITNIEQLFCKEYW